MYYKSSFLTFIVVFSTIFILSCDDNKKLSVRDISVTEESFTFEIEGDNSFCKKINEFKILSKKGRMGRSSTEWVLLLISNIYNSGSATLNGSLS